MKLAFATILTSLAIVPNFASASSELDSFVCVGNRDVVEGVNREWATHEGGEPRAFRARLPKVDKDTPVAVIFSWHGLGDTQTNWSRNFDLFEYSSLEFPFIVITPIETQMRPWSSPAGAAWDVFNGKDSNREFKLFESVLACLARTHNVDSDRIYSAGFSAGGMISNLLHSRYPHLVGAVFSGSAAWFNDPAQVSLINVPDLLNVEMTWPYLNSEDHGAVLITHGGEGDVFSMAFWTIFSFSDAGKVAKDFLTQFGRRAVVCAHEGGHSGHPEIWAKEVVQFFKAHRANTPSPYRSQHDLPKTLAPFCAVH